MKLSVRLESYALCGSGEGAGLIDSDVVHDSQGIPYLPGKRFKGLLRESALEVLEMLGMASMDPVAHIFGNDGFRPGVLKTPNLYPHGYDASWAEALSALYMAVENRLVTPASMLTEFTAIRQQTAIEADGVAKDASLRTSRMLKPGYTFEAELSVAAATPSISALLWLTARNLRRFGTYRNRGQGTISCTLSTDHAWSVRSAIDAVRKWRITGIPGHAALVKETAPPNDTTQVLSITIRTLSPVLLAMQSGDQNTVGTARCIPGSTVKGIFVDMVRSALALQNGKEHESAAFREFFLEDGAGSLSCSPAFPLVDDNVFIPAPLFMHRDKKQLGRVHNLLQCKPRDTKPMSGFIAEGPEGFLACEPATTLFFHNQRAQDRKRGKSLEGDGAIFYYEAIEKGQEFRTTLRGPSRLLSLALSSGNNLSASIGRSRSAQYGAVEVNLDVGEPQNNVSLCDAGTSLLVCLSPLIVRNEFGFPEPSTANLEVCLAKALAAIDSTRRGASHSQITVSVVSSHARTTTVEPYVGVIGCRLPACKAFREGSSFLVSITGFEPNDLSRHLMRLAANGIGDLCAMGFGSIAFSEPPSDPTFDFVTDNAPRKRLADVGTIPTGLKQIIAGVIRRKEEVCVAGEGAKDAELYGRSGRRLNNHQIGRLEAFVDSAEDLHKLREFLSALREPSKEKLQSYQTDEHISIFENIFSFIEPIDSHIKQFITDHSELIKHAGLISHSEEALFKLAKCYWKALLSRLRKLNKTEGD